MPDEVAKTEEASDLVSIRGTNCCVHHYQAEGSSPKALVVLYHGFLAHGAYPTVRYGAEFLAEAGYGVVAIDFPGHGKSEGLRGYLKSADDLIEDGIAMLQHAKSLYSDAKNLPLVLCGSSMGGAIALSVAHRLNQMQEKDKDPTFVAPSLILMAPMLKLNVSSLEHTALQCLAYMVPTARLIPSKATDPSKQYRDEKKREEVLNDPQNTPPGTKLRIGSALTCVDTTLKIMEAFDSITNPYLLLIADEDVVVKNEGSEVFHQKSPSQDKTKKNYPALHGLLCEPPPLCDTIKNDILDWLDKRIGK
mmetsp:Transcript_5392/g.13288  ORF Transcript_5392/g.13288 Transcript_5392/m.13288 type:complete len:306 (-) Transcript_5392:887-1804(-)